MFYKQQPQNSQTDTTVKKEIKSDPRYIKMAVNKKSLDSTLDKLIGSANDSNNIDEINRLNKFRKENFLNYQFILLPFKELDFLEQEYLSGEYLVTNDKITVNNFITSPYKKKNIHTQYLKDFSDIMLSPYSEKIKDPKSINSPYVQYNEILKSMGVFDKNEKNKKVDKSDYLTLSFDSKFLAQIYIVNDPIDPNNNGTIKLFNFSYAFLKSITNALCSDLINKIKLLQEESSSDERDKLLEDYNEELKLQLSQRFEALLKNKDKIVSVKFNVTDKAQSFSMYEKIDFKEVTEKLDFSGQYNLRELIIEFKNKYAPTKLRANLSKLGLTEGQIFEYRAYNDLNKHLQNYPKKLKVFNQINKFNFDDKLFYVENHVPTLPVLKNQLGQPQQSMVETVENFDDEIDDTNSNNYELNSVTDLDDDVPF